MMITKSIYQNIFRGSAVTGVRYYAKDDNPIRKTMNILSNDIPQFMGLKEKIIYPEHADIVVIGAGFIGASVAYWLRKRAGDGLSIALIDKDFSFNNRTRNVSLGMINQHFSLPENISLAQYTVEFLRDIKKNLGQDVDIQFTPTGSLVLASEKYADKMEENVTLMNELGIKHNLLTKENIKSLYPWINTEDVKLGCMAVESEGTFNTWELHKGLLNKCSELGTTFVNAEVTGFQLEKQQDVLMEGVAPGSFERITRVVYKTKDNEEYAIKFAVCVLAAGDNSGEIAKLARIGTGDGLLNLPLPIERREFQVYSVLDKGSETGLGTPLVTDTTGLWLMRNGLESNLFCGNIPLINDDSKNMTESDYFESIIKPSLLNRVPSCGDAKINKFTSEIHDCNTFDNTGVIGPHPYHNNLYLATGFGKLGCQHAPGIGRAIAELIIDSHYISVDLTRFHFDRFLLNEKLVEFNVY
ncbi:unnamed protein product [Chrysodeixis includens]|uniref:FAD-dependent oxidoreductase domain-containing protein 1 n=1 Tax=Chrysodeixis includens TaxID=689277 RepID=A0A9P0FZQ8_CHRIL|nr:unnamed protein product [Chrysodeixis includens]